LDWRGEEGTPEDLELVQQKSTPRCEKGMVDPLAAGAEPSLRLSSESSENPKRSERRGKGKEGKLQGIPRVRGNKQPGGLSPLKGGGKNHEVRAGHKKA